MSKLGRFDGWTRAILLLQPSGYVFFSRCKFGASVILAGAGIVSTKKITDSSQIMVASIPIVFSIQQFTEGFVWLSLNHEAYHHLQNFPIAVFLILAQVIWPVWVPFAFFMIEIEKSRRRGLAILSWLGVLLSLFLIYRLVFYPFSAALIPYHVQYTIDTPLPGIMWLVNICYFLTTIIPPFYSSAKRTKILGLLNFVSFVLAALFFKDYVISVWCFFAALISWEVIAIMKRLKITYAERAVPVAPSS